MHLHVSDHPLVAARITALRDAAADSPAFRTLVDDLATLLALPATAHLRSEPRTVTTPLGEAHGSALAAPAPLLVPILRAGLGMLPALMRVVPEAEVGFLGMARDEATHQAATYTDRIPADIRGRQCLVLDPMLATGGSLSTAIELLLGRGAADITAVCLLASEPGLQRMRERFDDSVTVVVAAVDPGLNSDAFIVPGLGDAGDRLFGAV